MNKQRKVDQGLICDRKLYTNRQKQVLSLALAELVGIKHAILTNRCICFLIIALKISLQLPKCLKHVLTSLLPPGKGQPQTYKCVVVAKLFQQLKLSVQFQLMLVNLVFSCHKDTGFMAALAAELSLAVAEAGAVNLSHLCLKQSNVND